MVTVAVRLGGAAATMHSCSVCETRFWLRDGEVIELDEVLGALRSPTPKAAKLAAEIG